MVLRMRFFVLLIVFSLFIGNVWAQTSQLSSSSTSSSSSAPPKKNTCCFCVHPNPGERDSDYFKNWCTTCLPQKFSNCDISKTVSASDFTPAFVKQFNCGKINQFNLQHGPHTEQVINQIQVCHSAAPTCSINVNDASCSTYGEDSEAQKAVKAIQDSTGGKVQVTICGSASDNFIPNCEQFRISKKYIISPKGIREELGLCEATGVPCTPPGSEFDCKDTLGRKWKQKCCQIQKVGLGLWGTPGHGCGGKSSCSESSCPTRLECQGDKLATQMCVPLNDSKITRCMKVMIDCKVRGDVCVQEADGDAHCKPRQSSSSAASSPTTQH